MGTLEDAFPLEIKEDFVDRSVGVGAVLYMRVEGVDHPKYFIIMGENEEELSLASVYINTPSPFYVNTPRLQALQKEIHPSDYSFLDHTSHIDCTVIIPRNKQYIQNLVRNKPEIFKTTLSQELITDIKINLLSSPNITRVDLIKYGLIKKEDLN